MTGPALQPGDVILAMGTSDLSKAIREMTGGMYSHTALWSGASVIESTLPQAQEVPYSELAAKVDYMDAIRHCELHGCEAQVVNAARPYVGRPYAVYELIVASAIGTLSAWLYQKSEWLALNTRYQAARARYFLTQLTQLYHAATQENVTCVELVARAHLRAGLSIEVSLDPSGKIDPKILWKGILDLERRARAPAGAREGGGPHGWPLEELKAGAAWAAEISERVCEARARTADLALESSVQWLRQLPLDVHEHWDDGPGWYAGLVTPRQLADSPSFECLGRLPRDREPTPRDPVAAAS